MSASGDRLGRAGEAIAAAYLENQGYRLIARNYRERFGEIDIIAHDGETLVFIEVKTRRTTRFGSPLEAVTRTKQLQIGKTAAAYLSRYDQDTETPVRFDVIGIAVTGARPDIIHVRNAFDIS